MAQAKIYGVILCVCLLVLISIARVQQTRVIYPGGCGQRAFSAIAAVLNQPKTDKETAALFRNNSEVVSFYDIQQAASRIGLLSKASAMTVAQLQAERPLGILHVDGTHFVAVVGYDSQSAHIVDRLYVGDAYRKSVRWSYGDLQARWDGRILVIRKP